MSIQAVGTTFTQHLVIGTPSSPPSGKIRLYPKADGNFYKLNSAGVETALGGGISLPLTVPLTFGTDPTPPYIKTAPNAQGSLLLEAPAAASSYLFVCGRSGAALNGNAYWDGTTWNRFNTAQGSTHITASGDGTFAVLTAGAAANPIAWTERMSISNAGALSVGGTLTVTGGTSLTSLNTSARVVATMATGAVGSAGSSEGQLEANNAGSGAAKISFHRAGAYAAYLGIDTDNQWKVGGWSMGGAAYRIHHDGIITYSTSATASSLVQRDGNGYIFGTYINLSADVQGGSPVYVAGQNGDGYLRWYPKSLVGPPALAYASLTTSAGASGGGAWTNCTFSGSGNSYVRNDSSQMTILRPGNYAIYAAGAGYYAVGVRIYVDGVVQASQTGNSNDFMPVGAGWTGYCGSWVQVHRYGQVSQGAAAFQMTFVPTDQYPR